MAEHIAKAALEKLFEIPMIRKTLDEVLKSAGAAAESLSGAAGADRYLCQVRNLASQMSGVSR